MSETERDSSLEREIDVLSLYVTVGESETVEVAGMEIDVVYDTVWESEFDTVADADVDAVTSSVWDIVGV